MNDAISGLWLEMLDQIAARNGSVDLMPWQDAEHLGSSRNEQRHRVRLLAISQTGELIVQPPAKPSHHRWLEPGVWTGVLVDRKDQRWLGRCEVSEVIPDFTLNDRTRIPAIRLAPAAEIRSGQRRNAYRPDTSLLRLAPAQLTPLIDTPPRPPLPRQRAADAQSVSAESNGPVKATILNISTTGLGISVNPSAPAVKQLLKSRRYHCRLAIPAFDKPTTVVVRLVHVKPQQDNTVYLGLQFEFNTPTHRRTFQDALSRFITDLQRDALRRRRTPKT